MNPSLEKSKNILNLNLSSWQGPIDSEVQAQALTALEQGKILFMPTLSLSLTDDERRLLAPEHVDPRSKNISFNPATGEVRGIADDAAQQQLKALLNRYAKHSQALIQQLLPRYTEPLQIGRTSLRPVEVKGRVSPSYRKDDTRLHVDAFPASPNQGRRILRVFNNINFNQQPRVWRVGEAFIEVAKRFVPKIPAPLPGSALLLQRFKITKGRRTAYDHYMLQLHDRMKADMDYQRSVAYEEIHFPANSTWIVMTDQVSHAALAGQHMLEQTFYLPVGAMEEPAQSPLKILESLVGRSLLN
jgi:hypothetical protein